MKKRLASIFLAATLALSLFTPVLAAGAGLENFQSKNVYTSGQFTDVKSGDWYEESLKTAYQIGLIKGTSETTFSPNGPITIAQALALACRLRSIYYTGEETFVQGEPWYQVYVDYAVSSGIIKSGQFSDYTAKATRAQFAGILANALPADALNEINTMDDGVIPDVKMDATYASEIYRLYKAGIMVGSDARGTFHPDTNIRRCEVAAVLTRITDRSFRRTFVPYVEVTGVSLDQTTLTLPFGKTATLKASVWPSNATDKTLSWSSSNPSVATVENGSVKAVAIGTATIKATAGSRQVICTVTVVESTAKWYSEGMYRVGIDIPAGDYYAVSDENRSGYYCKYTDSSQDKIEDNDNFNSFTFFRAYDGQYLKLSRCKITDISNAPIPVAEADSAGYYGEGVYRVGIDIPAGEYRFEPDGDRSAYYCVYSDITYEKIVNNDNFNASTYYTVKAGQYLKIERSKAVLISAPSKAQSGGTSAVTPTPSTQTTGTPTGTAERHKGAYRYLVNLATRSGYYRNGSYYYSFDSRDGTDIGVIYDISDELIMGYLYSSDSDSSSFVTIAFTEDVANQYQGGLKHDYRVKTTALFSLNPASFTENTTSIPFTYITGATAMQYSYQELAAAGVHVILSALNLMMLDGGYSIADLGFVNY